MPPGTSMFPRIAISVSIARTFWTPFVVCVRVE